MQSTLINNKVKVVQGDDQIYHYIAINNSTIDLDTLKEMTRIGDEWNGDKICGNLVDLREMFFIDSKTREYAAAQFRPHVAGMAILVGSRVSSYFANIFLKFSKPKSPTKLFTKEDIAIEWLLAKIAERKLNED